MTYRGHIKNGMVVLDPPVKLPDGTPARVEVESGPVGSEFWHGKTIEELAREQGVKPINNLDELIMDWPAEDSIDEFMALVREVRR